MATISKARVDAEIRDICEYLESCDLGFVAENYDVSDLAWGINYYWGTDRTPYYIEVIEEIRSREKFFRPIMERIIEFAKERAKRNSDWNEIVEILEKEMKR